MKRDRRTAMKVAIGPSKRILASPNYKWWAYTAVGTGMFLSVVDFMGVSIALPRIAEHFSASLPTVQWITLGHVLGTSAFLMPVGRLSDMIGRKRVYTSGLLIFIIGALLGGSAQTFAVLVAAKVVQGAGLACIQANGMAIIAAVFPDRERGKALGLYLLVIGVGSIVGPIFGGLLVSTLGWRALFFATVPMGLLSLASVAAVLRSDGPDTRGAEGGPRFDWPGAGMSSGSLVSFLLAMTNGYRAGWASAPVVAGFAVAFVLLIAFILWELRATDPMFDLRSFRNRGFSLTISAAVLSFLGSSSVFFLMPFYLVQVLGHAASRAGLVLGLSSASLVLSGTIGGRLSDRVGTRWPGMLGMLSAMAALLVLSRLTIDSSLILAAVGMVMLEGGTGAFSASNSSAALSSMGRDRYSIVSSIVSLARTSATVTGIALATTIVTLTMGALGYEPSLGAVSLTADQEGVNAAFVTGMRRALLVSSAFMLSALVLTALRHEPSSIGTSGPTITREPRPAPSPAED